MTPEALLKRMTFQIAFCAADGWLIASDRFRTLAFRLRSGSETQKVINRPDLGLGYAFAGDDCAILAGQMLEQRFNSIMSSPDIRRELAVLGNDAWDEAKRTYLNPPHPAHVRSLLIGTTQHGMWDLRIAEKSSIASDFNERSAVAGDESSPALFFAERYYSRDQSVDALMPLAAHVILTGGHFAANYVRGLEMLVCKAGRFTMYESGCDVLRKLEAASVNLTKQIGVMILDSNIMSC